MTPTDSEARFFDRLVTLGDTLVTGFDIVELADHLVTSCLEFLPISSAGIMLDDQQGNLRILASSSEESRVLELMELQNNEGPCLEAFATGEPVFGSELRAAGDRWPAFAGEAGTMGIRAAYALPMQLRGRTIGALNLFCDHSDALSSADVRIAHVMTTMATLGIINHWTIRSQEVLAEQLQTALNGRVIIEQAKGVLAERAGVDMATAFEMLRASARSSRRPLTEVATEVAHGQLPS